MRYDQISLFQLHSSNSLSTFTYLRSDLHADIPSSCILKPWAAEKAISFKRAAPSFCNLKDQLSASLLLLKNVFEFGIRNQNFWSHLASSHYPGVWSHPPQATAPRMFLIKFANREIQLFPLRNISQKIRIWVHRCYGGCDSKFSVQHSKFSFDISTYL